MFFESIVNIKNAFAHLIEQALGSQRGRGDSLGFWCLYINTASGGKPMMSKRFFQPLCHVNRQVPAVLADLSLTSKLGFTATYYER